MLVVALLGLLFMPLVTSAGATHASSAAAEPPDTMAVSMTAYNAVPGQTDGTPYLTASGAYSDPNVVAARSQDLASELPFGTVIEITAASSSPSCGYGAVSQDVGLRVIADAMNIKMKNKIDILLPEQQKIGKRTEDPAVVLGICKNVAIKIVGHINVNDMPQTQGELAAALDSSAQLAVAK